MINNLPGPSLLFSLCEPTPHSVAIRRAEAAQEVQATAASRLNHRNITIVFDRSNDPYITYFDREKRALFTAQRVGDNIWNNRRTATSAGVQSVTLNERTNATALSYLNRPRTNVFSDILL